MKKNTVSATSTKKLTLLIVLGAVLLTTYVSFSPALKNGFINWDDNAYVFENRHLDKRMGEAIPYFFGPHYFIGNYVPVTMTVFALEYKAAKLDAKFYHKVNVFLHLINIMLVFWFMYLLSGKKLAVAAFVALIFGIHPMHVESVAWVSELKDLLYGLCFLAALIVYLNYIDFKTQNSGKSINPFLRSHLVVFLFFVLSVLSKPAAIVLPVVLLLIDFYRERKFDKWTWIEKIPYFIVSVIFGIIAIKAQRADNLLHNDYALTDKLFFASHSMLVYIYKFFLPVNLAMFYPYPKPEAGLPLLYYLAPMGVFVIFYLVYRTLKQTRLVVFGFLFFVVNILLVLQFVSIGDAVLAERYTYISYLGLLFAVGFTLNNVYEGSATKFKALKPYVLPAAVIAALVFSVQTYARCKVWKNDETIARDLMSKFPDDRLVQNNMGFILYEQHKYSEAIELYKKAIAQKPDYTRASINIVNAYFELNAYDIALEEVNNALKFEPHNSSLLNQRGFIFYSKHSYHEAIKCYDASLKESPENTYTYIYLSQCYFELKNYEESLQVLDKGLTYSPQSHYLLNNKGYTLLVMHRYSQAAEYFKMALAAQPDYRTAAVNLQNCNKALQDSARFESNTTFSANIK